jgi:ABC-type multidrug transport system fused ATPase/permease subunit
MLTYADVRYGAVAADVEAGEEEVHAAARLAQLHDRVMGWADGYATGVGEKGMRLRYSVFLLYCFTGTNVQILTLRACGSAAARNSASALHAHSSRTRASWC